MLRRRLGLCRGPPVRSRGGGKRARGSAEDHASDFRAGGIGNGLRLGSDAPGPRPRDSLFHADGPADMAAMADTDRRDRRLRRLGLLPDDPGLAVGGDRRLVAADSSHGASDEQTLGITSPWLGQTRASWFYGGEPP